jgi:hypothetical protein
MAIGGTITSATAGSALFAGTSGVLAQDNANYFWDNTNKRLGIGVTTPQAKVDITATSGSFVNKFGDGTGSVSFKFNRATTANSWLTMTTTGTDGLLYEYSHSTRPGFNFIVPGVHAMGLGVDATGLVISNTNAAFPGTSLLKVINSTGNLLLNTTTDAGFKIDVNGTSRFQNLATFTDNVLITKSTVGNNNLTINCASSQGSELYFRSATTNLSGRIIGTGNTLSYGTYIANQLSLIGGTGGLALRTNNANNIRFYATNSDEDFSTVQQQMFASTGNVHFQNGGTYTDVPSARVAVNSTTQGILFPRMTTSEKNAIASPAEGLIVYDLTLHKLCVRTASAWEVITSL